MTEDQARAALRAFIAVGGLEAWIADQRWEAVPGGWRVRERLQGWHFRLEPLAGGLRVVMSARGSGPAEWFVQVRDACYFHFQVSNAFWAFASASAAVLPRNFGKKTSRSFPSAGVIVTPRTVAS